jgi:predicted sulfurtransferase
VPHISHIGALHTTQRTTYYHKCTLAQGCELNLGGRLRIAREGFNGTVSGTYTGVRAFADALRCELQSLAHSHFLHLGICEP